MLLSKFIPEDKELYLLLVFDEQAMGMNYGRVFTPEEAELLFSAMMEANAEEGHFGFYKAYADGEFAGMGALTRGEDAAEIEYMLLPRFWGRGLGTELAGKLADMARAAGVKRLAAMTDPANIRSKRILLKLGFTLAESFLNDEGEPVELYNKIIEEDNMETSENRPVCQCCGMPLDADSVSREPDGTLNPDYCKWCYADGKFTYTDMEELIDFCTEHFANEQFTKEQMRAYMEAALPNLKHWKERT